MELPVYRLVISDNEADEAEVNFVSLVDSPAIQRNFLQFKEARQMFAVQDDEQRIVSGPAMVPDFPMFRNDQMGQYYAVFDAQTINSIAYRFFKKGYQANINEDHQVDALVKDSVFFESWIVDRQKGKHPLNGYDDMPDGTWFLTAKINNADTWERIKSGELKGFSVEGLFEFVKVGDPVDPEAAILAEVQKIIESVKE
jgi:hypothetical protein